MNSPRVSIARENPWVFRRFLNKDNKLLVRERYWHSIDEVCDVSNLDDDEVQILAHLIPSALSWRKYFSLWTKTENFLSNPKSRGDDEKIEVDGGHSCRLILLESAVELMDWRNTSPNAIMIHDDASFSSQPESAAFQERNRLCQLLERRAILPFCDLSHRRAHCDEFDLLEYHQMDLSTRSQQALYRAGHLWHHVVEMSCTTTQKGTPPMVILVVDDEDYRPHHDDEIEGLLILSVDELLEWLHQQQALSDSEFHATQLLKSKCLEDYKRRNAPISVKSTDLLQNQPSTMEHWSEDKVDQGLSDGTLYRGRLQVSDQNPKEGFVTISTTTTRTRYFINHTLGHFCRSLHQDLVIIEPLPKDKWTSPIGRRRLIHAATEDNEHDALNSDATSNHDDVVPSARVVAISASGRRRYVATLVDVPNHADERAVLVVPMNLKIPKIRIQTKSWHTFVGQRLLVDIIDWEPTSHYPHGHVVEILGPIGDLETEIACLLEENQIRLKPFSALALANLPPQGNGWNVPLSDIMERRDLRKSHRIFSVDPPGCQDIDDTMHAKVLSNGDVEVGVHIADVTHFVPHNSALDKEAQIRGTTFYLVDRRFDMLPSLLSSNLCSLHGHVDRLAVSVIWTLSPDLNTVKSTWYGKTVIHNYQAMTYEQAHNILHDLPPDDPQKPPPPPLTAGAPVHASLIPDLKKDLSILTRLARKLRKDREEIGGAVDLSSADVGSELKFELDQDGNPTKVSSKKDLEIHHTIAEMMIMANQSVARKIFESFPQSALLRIHRTVEESRFEDLEAALTAGGIKFDGSSNMKLAKSLEQAQQEGKDGKVVNSLWQSLATRAMSEALYVSTGHTEEDVGLSHYGLGIDKYTHFTSPIRRYADVVVHKQLLASLHNESLDLQQRAPPGFIQREALKSLPDSSAISIMRGEGLKEKPNLEFDDEDDFLDSLIEGAAEQVTGIKPPVANNVKDTKAIMPDPMIPYNGNQVSRICDGLNQQNRMAKMSSMNCQKLFLSLYFDNKIEFAQGVITDLRANGFLVYVPKFDMKGPVYLSDVNGDIQIDPALVGLQTKSGSEPTLGFTECINCRRFPAGSSNLIQDVNDKSSKLEITIPGAPKRLTFCILDVVNVQISCDLSNVKARIPSPRLFLVKSSRGAAKSTVVRPKALTSDMLKETRDVKIKSAEFVPSPNPKQPSIYSQIDSLVQLTPYLDVPIRTSVPSSSSSHFTMTMPGRKIFSNFKNPDTRGALQEQAINAASDAATQRRAAALASVNKRNEFTNSKAIEQSVTSRAQKLAASKRNAKRSKAKSK